MAKNVGVLFLFLLASKRTRRVQIQPGASVRSLHVPPVSVWVLWVPPQSKHIHGVRLMGIFKLTVGVNVSGMVGCFSVLALQQIADLSSVYCTASLTL